MRDYGVVPEVRWSDGVEQATWIAERLDSWDRSDAALFIPRGFESYVRLLHPGSTHGPELHPVRWAQMAEWSGLQLAPESGLEGVALPLDERTGPRPWDWGPREGSLEEDDLLALIDVLGRHTATSERCFFCIWDGDGWDRKVVLSSGRPGAAHESLADPIPKDVRNGSRVRLPNRDYFLYEGGLDDATAWMDSEGQSPNLWWPEDRSWCVATEIDLPWSYVGGSHQLATDLLSDRRLEGLPAQPDDPLHHDDDQLVSQAADAARELPATGEVTITTGVGTLRAWLGLPKRRGRIFHCETVGTNRRGRVQQASSVGKISSTSHGCSWARCGSYASSAGRP